MIKNILKEQFNWIILITLIFFISVGFDISPYVRGPAPYPPDWRWPYLFINTLDRIYLPLLIILFIVCIFWFTEKRNKIFERYTIKFLLLLILLSFLFQLSVQFFSRAGISVLIHRIINPELNGYFTAALPIRNIFDFLRTYNDNILTFIYHAKSHPPGAILFFYFIKQMMLAIPLLGNIANSFTPNHADVRALWTPLLPAEKATAIISSFLIPFLSTLTIIPLYYTSKILYGTKTALRSVILFIFIPSVVLFIPINDSFLHFFAITSVLFLIKGLKAQNTMLHFLYLLFSGLFLFCGILFNLSLLPLVILLGTYFLLFKINKLSSFNKNYSYYFKEIVIKGIFFGFGFLLMPVLLFFIFKFNFIQMLEIIMGSVPDVHTRSYTLWIFYNLWDLFIFAGIPIAVVFFISLKHETVNLIIKKWNKIDHIFISFLIMLLILNFSGSIRGETGRILVIFMPFMALIGANFATRKLKLNTVQFGIFIILQAIQILILQEFWVLLW